MLNTTPKISKNGVIRWYNKKEKLEELKKKKKQVGAIQESPSWVPSSRSRNKRVKEEKDEDNGGKYLSEAMCGKPTFVF